MLDTMDFDFVAATLDKYGLSDRFDAKKVLLKMGGRRPGKHCVGKAGGKGSYIAAEKKCAAHKGADGKLTQAGKSSAGELAVRVRHMKGMPEKYEVKFARRSLAENLAPSKGAHTEKILASMMRKEHKESRAALNKRRINGGREAIVDKKAPRSPKASSERNAPKVKSEVMKEVKQKATGGSDLKQLNYATALSSIGNGFPNRPKMIKDWADKHNIVLDELIANHGAGLTPKAAKKNSPEFLALLEAVYNDKPFKYKGKKTKNMGIRKSISEFIN